MKKKNKPNLWALLGDKVLEKATLALEGMHALEDGAKLALAAGWSRAQFVTFFADIAGATYDQKKAELEQPKRKSAQGGSDGV